MEVSSCDACYLRLMNNHRCSEGPWNVQNRTPNFISGYTGKIPLNVRWTGNGHPAESRDFNSQCRAPVNNFYVVHPEQYLPDGTLALPKITSDLPNPLVMSMARFVNHQRQRGGSDVCHHPHPIDTPNSRDGYLKLPTWTSFRHHGVGKDLPCRCGSLFFNYRLQPSDDLKEDLKHGRCV